MAGDEGRQPLRQPPPVQGATSADPRERRQCVSSPSQWSTRLPSRSPFFWLVLRSRLALRGPEAQPLLARPTRGRLLLHLPPPQGPPKSETRRACVRVPRRCPRAPRGSKKDLPGHGVPSGPSVIAPCVRDRLSVSVFTPCSVLCYSGYFSLRKSKLLREKKKIFALKFPGHQEWKTFFQ